MQHAPEKKNGDDRLPIPPYMYIISAITLQKIFSTLLPFFRRHCSQGAPADYDFESHKELVPMQPGDVPITYADTTPLEQDFDFKPSTSLREGLRAFVQWYAKYYGTK